LWHILYFYYLLLPRWGVFWGVALVLRALPQAIAVSPLGFFLTDRICIFSAIVIFLNKIHPKNAPKGQ
jgi:hypothetical protein